jgi:hypothetical protein
MTLTAGDVQKAFVTVAADSSSRTVQIAHNVLVRTIQHAERNDLVARNVAALVKPPKGRRDGRPSKSFTLGEAVQLMTAAVGTRFEAYIGFRAVMLSVPTADEHATLKLGTASRKRIMSLAGDAIRAAKDLGLHGPQTLGGRPRMTGRQLREDGEWNGTHRDNCDASWCRRQPALS